VQRRLQLPGHDLLRVPRRTLYLPKRKDWWEASYAHGQGNTPQEINGRAIKTTFPERRRKKRHGTAACRKNT